MLRLICYLTLIPGLALAQRFDFRDALQRNSVYFVSDGLLEKTVGLSTALTGWVEIDPEKPGEMVQGEWEVDVRLFQTGFEARNEAIREKFFKAFEYPIATFHPTKWTTPPKGKLVDSKSQVAKVEGELSLRGVKKTIPVDLRLTFFKPSELTSGRLNGQLLRVSADFDLNTETFSLPIPESLKGHYAKTVQIHVDAVGTDRPPQGVPALETTKPK